MHKHIAWTIALLFTLQSIAFGAPAAYTIKVPEELGKVSQRYKAPKSDHRLQTTDYRPRQSIEGLQSSVSGLQSEKLVIHIQDAHTNLYAQENLAKIICNLLPQITKDRNMPHNSVTPLIKGGVTTPFIGIEGATKRYNLNELRRHASETARETVGLEFVEDGSFIGAELANIIADRDIELVGLEDKILFQEDFSAFFHVKKHDLRIREYLKILTQNIDTLKDNVYSEKLRRFDERAISPHERDDIANYLPLLCTTIKKNNLPLEAYPHLCHLAEIIDALAKLNQQSLTNEWNALNALLMPQRTQRTGEKQVSIPSQSSVSSVAINKNIIQTTIAEATKAGIKLNSYPTLQDAHELWTRFGSVAMETILEEMTRAENDIRNTLARTQDEQLLVSLARQTALLAKVLTLEATRSEVNDFEKTFTSVRSLFESIKYLSSRYGNQKPLFKPRRTQRNREKSKFKKPVSIPSQSSVLSVANDTNTQTFLTNTLKTARIFYDKAKERDAALVENLLAEMDRRGENIGILIAGGFHSSGIKDILQDKGIDFITVTPHMRNAEITVDFLSRMLGGIGNINPSLTHALNTSFITGSLAEIDPTIFWQFVKKAGLEIDKEMSVQAYFNAHRNELIELLQLPRDGDIVTKNDAPQSTALSYDRETNNASSGTQPATELLPPEEVSMVDFDKLNALYEERVGPLSIDVVRKEILEKIKRRDLSKKIHRKLVASIITNAIINITNKNQSRLAVAIEVEKKHTDTILNIAENAIANNDFSREDILTIIDMVSQSCMVLQETRVRGMSEYSEILIEINHILTHQTARIHFNTGVVEIPGRTGTLTLTEDDIDTVGLRPMVDFVRQMADPELFNHCFDKYIHDRFERVGILEEDINARKEFIRTKIFDPRMSVDIALGQLYVGGKHTDFSAHTRRGLSVLGKDIGPGVWLPEVRLSYLMYHNKEWLGSTLFKSIIDDFRPVIYESFTDGPRITHRDIADWERLAEYVREPDGNPIRERIKSELTLPASFDISNTATRNALLQALNTVKNDTSLYTLTNIHHLAATNTALGETIEAYIKRGILKKNETGHLVVNQFYHAADGKPAISDTEVWWLNNEILKALMPGVFSEHLNRRDVTGTKFLMQSILDEGMHFGYIGFHKDEFEGRNGMSAEEAMRTLWQEIRKTGNGTAILQEIESATADPLERLEKVYSSSYAYMLWQTKLSTNGLAVNLKDAYGNPVILTPDRQYKIETLLDLFDWKVTTEKFIEAGHDENYFANLPEAAFDRMNNSWIGLHLKRMIFEIAFPELVKVDPIFRVTTARHGRFVYCIGENGENLGTNAHFIAEHGRLWGDMISIIGLFMKGEAAFTDTTINTLPSLEKQKVIIQKLLASNPTNNMTDNSKYTFLFNTKNDTNIILEHLQNALLLAYTQGSEVNQERMRRNHLASLTTKSHELIGIPHVWVVDDAFHEWEKEMIMRDLKGDNCAVYTASQYAKLKAQSSKHEKDFVFYIGTTERSKPHEIKPMVSIFYGADEENTVRELFIKGSEVAHNFMRLHAFNGNDTDQLITQPISITLSPADNANSDVPFVISINKVEALPQSAQRKEKETGKTTSSSEDSVPSGAKDKTNTASSPLSEKGETNNASSGTQPATELLPPEEVSMVDFDKLNALYEERVGPLSIEAVKENILENFKDLKEDDEINEEEMYELSPTVFFYSLLGIEETTSAQSKVVNKFEELFKNEITSMAKEVVKSNMVTDKQIYTLIGLVSQSCMALHHTRVRGMSEFSEILIEINHILTHQTARIHFNTGVVEIPGRTGTLTLTEDDIDTVGLRPMVDFVRQMADPELFNHCFDKYIHDRFERVGISEEDINARKEFIRTKIFDPRMSVDIALGQLYVGGKHTDFAAHTRKGLGTLGKKIGPGVWLPENNLYYIMKHKNIWLGTFIYNHIAPEFYARVLEDFTDGPRITHRDIADWERLAEYVRKPDGNPIRKRIKSELTLPASFDISNTTTRDALLQALNTVKNDTSLYTLTNIHHLAATNTALGETIEAYIKRGILKKNETGHLVVNQFYHAADGKPAISDTEVWWLNNEILKALMPGVFSEHLNRRDVTGTKFLMQSILDEGMHFGYIGFHKDEFEGRNGMNAEEAMRTLWQEIRKTGNGTAILQEIESATADPLERLEKVYSSSYAYMLWQTKLSTNGQAVNLKDAYGNPVELTPDRQRKIDTLLDLFDWKVTTEKFIEAGHDENYFANLPEAAFDRMNNSWIGLHLKRMIFEIAFPELVKVDPIFRVTTARHGRFVYCIGENGENLGTNAHFIAEHGRLWDNMIGGMWSFMATRPRLRNTSLNELSTAEKQKALNKELQDFDATNNATVNNRYKQAFFQKINVDLVNTLQNALLLAYTQGSEVNQERMRRNHLASLTTKSHELIGIPHVWVVDDAFHEWEKEMIMSDLKGDNCAVYTASQYAKLKAQSSKHEKDFVFYIGTTERSKPHEIKPMVSIFYGADEKSKVRNFCVINSKTIHNEMRARALQSDGSLTPHPVTLRPEKLFPNIENAIKEFASALIKAVETFKAAHTIRTAA